MHRLTPPFSITLPGTADDNRLECRRAVRSLPGRRLVCAGSWQGRDVYAKLYFNSRKARPPLLFSGDSPQGDCHVLVLAAIAPAQTLTEAWQDTTDRQEREGLLKVMARVFAQHHNAGITQDDPHLNNFLVTSDSVYTLDGADIGRRNHPLRARQALRNLAAFYSIIRIRPDAMAEIFFKEYAAARNITLSLEDYHRFTRLVRQTGERNIRKYLRNKIFRECTAFSRQRSFTRLSMLGRPYDSPGMQQLISTPGDFLKAAAAKTLKRGNTATVASLPVDGRTIVIKHYRVKGILHGLRKTCVRSRAENSWINAHRLQRYGIRTAPPVALIMNTIGPFRLDAYIITGHIPGPNAADFFNSPTVSMADKTTVAGRLAGLLRQLAVNRLHHGDLKATNIIISGMEPVLLDLDSMQQYRSDTKKFRQAFNKDLERFRRNWSNGTETDALLHELTEKVATEFL